MQAEVVVEADPEQAPAAADRERDRQHHGDRDRHRQPGAQRPGGLVRLRGRRAPAATTTSSSAPSVALVPCPGARASRPVTVRIAPKPTAGSSHVQACRPASEQQGATDQRARRRRSAPPRRKSRSSGRQLMASGAQLLGGALERLAQPGPRSGSLVPGADQLRFQRRQLAAPTPAPSRGPRPRRGGGRWPRPRAAVSAAPSRPGRRRR